MAERLIMACRSLRCRRLATAPGSEQSGCRWWLRGKVGLLSSFRWAVRWTNSTQEVEFV